MAHRRHHQNEIPSTSRWMVSYADFLTLLFAFFVVLYAISSVHNEKFKELSRALSGIFDQPTRSAKPIQLDNIFETLQLVPAPQPNDEEINPIIEQSDQIMATLWQHLETHIKAEKIFLRGSEDWVEVAVNADLVFPPGSALMTDDGDAMLSLLAETFKTFPNPINVEAFTDNTPVAENGPWQSNWELSAQRAAGVARILMYEGIAPQRLAAVAYAEYQPVATNDDEEGRQINRRILFVIDRLGNSRARVGEITKHYVTTGH